MAGSSTPWSWSKARISRRGRCGDTARLLKKSSTSPRESPALFERPGELDARIHGFPNWRQPILQDAIRAKKTIPFADLFALDGARFYADPGVHYGMARYILYWVQLKELLPTFYREFLAHRAEDPTGAQTLKRVLGEKDLPALQARWERWVLALAPPD
jgi:hypothetical protein